MAIGSHEEFKRFGSLGFAFIGPKGSRQVLHGKGLRKGSFKGHRKGFGV